MQRGILYQAYHMRQPQPMAQDLDPKTNPFEFARPSAVPNAGEDFPDSARHRRNRWRSLQAAEQDGSAATLVTRDELLKNEPPKFLSTLTPSTAISHLSAFFILRAFPPQPYSEQNYRAYSDTRQRIQSRDPDSPAAKTPAELRLDYYRAYCDLRSFLEDQAQLDPDPWVVMQSAKRWVDQRIRQLQREGHYSPVVRALQGFENKLKRRRRVVSTDVAAKIVDFTQRLQAANPEASLEATQQRVCEVIGGKSISLSFNQSQVSKFKESDCYAKEQTRTGGRGFSNYHHHLLLDHFGLRGIQFGNSVPDRERLQHLESIAQALADLADVVGWSDWEVAMGLGVAVGARGRGRSLAHYEPEVHLVNLSRRGGFGALAHEWAHSFDYKMAKDNFPLEGSNYLSVLSKKTGGDSLSQAMREVVQGFGQIGYRRRLEDTLIEMISAKKFSRKKASYWYATEEQFARCLERYVQVKLSEQGRQNSYLAGWISHPLWMTDWEIQAIAPDVENLLSTYRNQRCATVEITIPWC